MAPPKKRHDDPKKGSFIISQRSTANDPTKDDFMISALRVEPQNSERSNTTSNATAMQSNVSEAQDKAKPIGSGQPKNKSQEKVAKKLAGKKKKSGASSVEITPMTSLDMPTGYKAPKLVVDPKNLGNVSSEMAQSESSATYSNEKPSSVGESGSSSDGSGPRATYRHVDHPMPKKHKTKRSSPKKSSQRPRKEWAILFTLIALVIILTLLVIVLAAFLARRDSCPTTDCPTEATHRSESPTKDPDSASGIATIESTISDRPSSTSTTVTSGRPPTTSSVSVSTRSRSASSTTTSSTTSSTTTSTVDESSAESSSETSAVSSTAIVP